MSIWPKFHKNVFGPTLRQYCAQFPYDFSGYVCLARKRVSGTELPATAAAKLKIVWNNRRLTNVDLTEIS